jgi:hypothetical protein
MPNSGSRGFARARPPRHDPLEHGGFDSRRLRSVRRVQRSRLRCPEDFGFEPLTLTEGKPDARGDQVVYVKVLAHGRGKASEEQVEFDIHHVWRLREGLFARMDAYLDEGEGLEAAGLISET